MHREQMYKMNAHESIQNKYEDEHNIYIIEIEFKFEKPNT